MRAMDYLEEWSANLSPKQLALLNLKLRNTLSNDTKEVIPVQTNRDTFFPLSFSQERLWFLDQMAGPTPAYNLALPVAFDGYVDRPSLERALNEMIRRHEILRTSFGISEGRPVQIIARDLKLDLSIADLRSLPETTRSAHFNALTGGQFQKTFDLSRTPLIEAQLYYLTDAQSVLMLTMHHIISDGWSLGVFQRELSLLYKAFLNGELSPLPDLPLQFADYAVWQREKLEGSAGEADLRYWRGQLKGVSELSNLPVNPHSTDVKSFRGAMQYFPLKGSTVRQLRKFARSENVTLFVALLACFKALLHAYTAQDDIAVGSTVANRNRQELEGLIGFFVNTVVLRTWFSPEESFRTLLEHVREVTLDAYAHQEFPFERLVSELLNVRDPNRNPLFQVMFAFQGADGADDLTQTEDEYESPPPAEAQTVQAWSKFDLTFAVIDSGREMVAAWEYCTDLFEHQTISRMAYHFEILLDGVLAEPDKSLSALKDELNIGQSQKSEADDLTPPAERQSEPEAVEIQPENPKLLNEEKRRHILANLERYSEAEIDALFAELSGNTDL